MKYVNITEADQEMIDAASTIIKNNFLLGKHHVGSAVRAKSGKIYAGVHLESKKNDVCAEQVALGMAVSSGEREFDSIVAVTQRDVAEPTVISPCRTCQELLNFYGPEIYVIILVAGKLQKLKAKYF